MHAIKHFMEVILSVKICHNFHCILAFSPAPDPACNMLMPLSLLVGRKHAYIKPPASMVGFLAKALAMVYLPIQ